MNKSFHENFIYNFKNKKNIIVIFIILLTLINMSTYISPQCKITTQIIEVTNKDFQTFIKYSNIPVEKKTKENCRFISVCMDIKKPILFVRNIKINKISLKEYLDNNKNFKGMDFLGNYKYNSYYQFFDGIDVYQDGISDEKIKKFFGDYKIEVTWFNIWKRQKTQIFYLKDYFQ